MRLAVVLLALAASTACGESLSGLSSEPPPDAGAEGSTANDAASNDAFAGDSATDAAVDTSTGGPLCSSLSPAPIFCDDFEDATPLEANWAVVLLNGSLTKSGGNLVIANDALAASSAESHAYVTRSMSRPATIEVSFAFFADAQTTYRRNAAQVTVTNGAAFYHVEVTLAGPTELRLDEYAEPGFDGASYFSRLHSMNVSVVGGWKKVRFEVTHEGSPRARLWYEDAQFPNADIAITPTIVSSTVSVAIGTAILRGPMPASGMRFDDVVIRAK